MPYIAIHNGKKKAPKQLPKGVTVSCPECGGDMTVRGPFSDGRARHFWHTENIGGGSGGGSGNACESVAESDEHMKWKSLAADRLEYLFEENLRSCRMEMQLEAPTSNKDYRQADAIILFENRDEQLGQGVVIEVQHKNESKDIEATTRDYLDQDLAVVWADADDFGQNKMLLEEVDIRHRAKNAVWPDYVPPIQEWPQQATGKELVHDLAGELIAKTATSEETICPATLPMEYVNEESRRLYRETDWSELFDPPSADEYIQEVAATGVAGPVGLNMANVVRPIPRHLWEKHKEYFLGWFIGHEQAVAEGLQADPGSVVVPVTLPPDTTAKIEYLSSQLDGTTEVATCPHCGSAEIRDLYGETQLSTTCRECGEWLVFHKYGRTNPNQSTDIPLGRCEKQYQ